METRPEKKARVATTDAEATVALAVQSVQSKRSFGLEADEKGNKIISSRDEIPRLKSDLKLVEFPSAVYPWKNWKLIGEGSYGRVYSIWNELTETTTVVKSLEKKGNELQMLQELTQEVKVLRYLQPRCVPYFLCFSGAFEDATRYYLRTEFLGEYTTLESIIEQKQQARWQPKQVAQWIANMIRAVDALHAAGVAHRDLKPGNIMVSRTNGKIKLIDFGLSCIRDDCRMRNIGGTPAYLAPELYFREKAVLLFDDARKADYWALGATIWELVHATLYPEAREHSMFAVWLASVKSAGDLWLNLQQFLRQVNFTSSDVTNLAIRTRLEQWSKEFYLQAGFLSIDAMLDRDPKKRQIKHLGPELPSAPPRSFFRAKRTNSSRNSDRLVLPSS